VLQSSAAVLEIALERSVFVGDGAIRVFSGVWNHPEASGTTSGIGMLSARIGCDGIGGGKASLPALFHLELVFRLSSSDAN
jgi:hypothetical protein